ncbi:hypothetical protein [Sphingomonas sp. PP-CC-3A-396]|uniref:hypothetical protein n=1 Tax=Sphingomonas sp. PP-CC-3A-396 TaxID=2135655 RepID=UPI0010F03299|nr:hypothetical protein [Sphingomonas sp. PP-CC-3A-396]TCQ06446.1 hypothetical protein C8J40_105234 [Sphingomonas sp. PP-CC-3A-396]
MKVFWSWQSDRDPKLHHYFVRDAIKDACKLIVGDPDYEEATRPEVDHDTKDVHGSPDITSTILGKIASANVFIADMTPVGMTDPVALQPSAPEEKRPEPKFLQNPNVMSELGYAERALTQGKIILVANGAHYPGAEALPFDWRHRSGAKSYLLADGATNREIADERKRFAQVLKACIQPILASQAPATPEPREVVWHAASASDRAIWAGAEGDLRFRNASLEQPRQDVRLSEGVRIFARLVPAEWTPPPRSDLEARVNRVGLAIRSRDGDWGVNAEGAISIWGRFDEGAGATRIWNATQWFRNTGEIWAVNTNSFADHAGRIWFSTQVPFASLEDFLARAVAGIREMGGAGAIAIRLGAVGIGDTVLPSQYRSQFIEAVGTDAAAEGKSDEWTPVERRELLRRFWNDLMDAYGERPMTMQEFERAAALGALPA